MLAGSIAFMLNDNNVSQLKQYSLFVLAVKNESLSL